MSFFVSIALFGLLVGYFLLVAIFSAADDPEKRVASRPLPRTDASEPENEGVPGPE
ncbi:MAG TPA: hypothetical protein VNA88_06535 [Candidatus Kapabacteria bacterium]|jgi:hypothetical protein|nr:hypothetical protein [Candidatus Kapabacteria bacterium]